MASKLPLISFLYLERRVQTYHLFIQTLSQKILFYKGLAMKREKKYIRSLVPKLTTVYWFKQTLNETKQTNDPPPTHTHIPMPTAD